MKEKLEPIALGKAENLAGQKFGHLTALYRVANKNNRPTWQCQCDCGEYWTANARDLKNGAILSCGCAKNEWKIKDLTGQRFGKLLVLNKSKERASDGTILWECKCDCGNIVKIRAGNLKNQQSCGKCFSGKDLTGQRFGRLIALNYDHTSEAKRSIWRCQCDCGAIVFVETTSLTTGKTQSCGCIKSRGEEAISSLLIKHNIIFEKQKTFDTCHYTDTKAKPIFDFWVNNSYIIEYDGIQHFQPISGWSNAEAVEKIKAKDYEKNLWCYQNNIPIIRIPYTKLTSLCIEDLLLETSNYIIKENKK